MHRLITNCPDNMMVDHIYQVSKGICDNRKSNLEVCNATQNNINRQSINVSGYTGVSYDTNRGKWKASISVNNRTVNLGRFDNIEDAINARKNAEIKYRNEYRR